MKKLLLNVLLLLMTAIGALAQQSLPYSYGFEDNDLSVDGWTLNNCHASTGIYSGAAKTGSYGFRFYYRSNPPQYLISPELTGTANGVQVEFYYKNYSSSYNETFQVGYSTTDNSTGSFTWGDILTASDEQWTIFSENFPSNTKYVSVKLNSDDQFYLYLDDFSFTVPASCIKPSSLITSNITHNSIDLSWTQNSSTTDWVLEYSTNSDFSGAISKNVNGTPSYSLSNLNSSTTYYVRVKADCGGGDESDWSDAISFTTTAVAEEVGDIWSDDFEGATCGWLLINGGLTNAWAWGEAVNNGGSHALYVSNDGGTTNAYTVTSATMVYATKLLNFANGKYEFSYDWIANGESSWDYLRVALVPASVTLTAGTSVPSGFSSTALPSGWIALDGGSKLNLVTAWQTKELAVNVTAGNYYLVFAWRDDTSGGTNPPAAVDNVSITRMACAYDVTNLAVSNISTTTAKLTWTAGEASQWQVAYSTSNDFAGATEEIVSEATYNMTSLTSATTYYVKVRAYCGGSDFGAWGSVLEFNTACDAITAFPWVENFDGYTVASAYTPTSRTLPVCWNYVNACTYSNYKYYPTMSSYSYSSYAHSTSNYLKLYSYYSSYTDYDPQPQYAILPSMENLDTKRIVLWARGYDANSTFKIGLMTNPTDASSFVQIGDALSLTTSYQKFTINLTGTGNYIAIMIDAANSSRTTNGVYIDDITVEEQPTCLAPTALTITSYTATTATLTWTSGASETAWNLRYKGDGDADWTVINGVENPYTITGLDAETNYEVQVQADCGNGDLSAWSDSEEFYTGYCQPAPTSVDNSGITNVTFGTGDVVVNNSERPTTAPYYGNYYNLVGAVQAGVEANVNITYGTGYTYGTIIWIDLNNNLVFDGDEVVYVGESSGTNPTTLAATFMLPASTPTGDYRMRIAGADSYYNSNITSIAAAAEANPCPTGTYTVVHDYTIRVLAAPSCIPPTNVLASNITARTADLSWTAGGEETAWQICLNDDESNPIDVTNPYTLTGLTPETTYQVKVRSNCGGTDGDSEWTNNISFTTTVSCPAPINLAVSGLTPTSATIEWEAGAFETEWNLKYKADGDGDWTVENDVTSPYTITGLTAETDYEVQLQAVCALDDLSDWSSSVDVYTGYCQPAPTSRDGNGITGVSFGSGDDIVSNSNSNGLPAASPYYGDYTNLVGAVQAGVEATVSITYATGWTYGTIIWIDLNNNLIFEGNEVVYVGECASSNPTTLAATFTLPISIPAGDYRMRIAAADSYYDSYIASIAAAANANPCPSTTYTVVNDYTIRVLAAPTCFPPTALTASSIGATTATLTWTAGNGETAWQVCINGDEGNLIDVDASTYTMENLVAATDYTVKVRSNCGSDGVSDWSNDYEFTTAICGAEDQCQITYTLTDQYNDSWNGASISVVDVATNIVIANLSVQSGASPYTGTLAVCNGREIIFVWNTGSYDNEASYEVYDVNGIEIFSGSGAMDDDVTYTVDCTIKHTITASTADLNGTITPNGENLVVDGENLSYTIVPAECYHIASVLVDGEEAISNVDENGVYTFTNVTADHTIAASFALNTYEITTSVEGNGTITETSTVNCGDDKQITITPANDCYRIASVMVDGVEAITDVVDGVYTFANVTAQHVITARFEQITYSFTVNAGENGTITANDEIGNVANCGEDKSFTIAANEGYSIASVLVDGSDVTDAVIAANGVYTFENVTAEHTIAATFVQVHTISAGTGFGGSITPDGFTTVLDGESQSFTIVPVNECFVISQVMVDGVDVTDEVIANNGVYTFENVTENHNIVANFDAITLTITATAGEGGTITHNSDYENIPCGSNETYTIEANEGYRIASVIVDATEDVTETVIAADGVYTFENVTADHTISATFELIPVQPNTYTITATAGDNGSINPEGEVTVNEGENKSFSIVANDGYRIESVIVDAETNVTEAVVAADGVYTFENVTADHTIAATFELIPVQPNTYTITATAGENGTIDPASAEVMYGYDKTFTITPDEGYRIATVVVDAETEGEANVTENVVAGDGYYTYTFTNVTANHTIHASFEAIPTYTITVEAGEHGNVYYNDALVSAPIVVNEGATPEFEITPATGYQIDVLTVGGNTIELAEQQLGGFTYTFEPVRADITLTVTFEAIPVTHAVTLTVGEHGTVTATDEDDNEIAIVDGVITVNDDDDLYLVITPEENYQIGELIVDGTPVELEEEDLAGFIFPILGVSSDMAVSVTFVPVSSAEMFEAGSMAVYPNPNNGMFSIDFSNIEGDATYEIINANGAVVETRDINVMNGETMNFNHDLRPGTYFVRIINGDKVYVEQIVVE